MLTAASGPKSKGPACDDGRQCLQGPMMSFYSSRAFAVRPFFFMPR